MALTYNELESTTDHYIKANGGKAQDIIYTTSALCNRYMKEKKGLWELAPGGRDIKVQVHFDYNIGDFYDKGDPVSSDVREILNTAIFKWKNSYGNGSILQQDEAMNRGPEQEVSMITAQVDGALATVGYNIANHVYDANGDDDKYITGARSMTSESSSTAYGGIAEDDLTASDGTKPWEGKTVSTSQSITTANVRDLMRQGKCKEGPQGRVTFGTTTESLFASFKDKLQLFQRFTENDSKTTNAGFSNLKFDGMILVPDDFCPSGNMFLFNDNYYGFAVMKGMNLKRTKWTENPLPGVPGKSMKVWWMGNAITNNRKSHIRHSALTA